jgi:opacity protein-like surface antigen
MSRLVACLAAIFFAQPALAGDLPVTVDAAPDGVDWSGGTVSAFGGLSIGTGHATRGDYAGPLITLDVQNGLFPDSVDQDDVGAAFGVAAGWNVQSGQFVGGIEADIGYSWLDAGASESHIDPNPLPIFNGVHTNTTYETEFGVMGSVRLRGGYAFGSSLIYGTFGVAGGDVRNNFALAIPELAYTSPDWSESGMRYGYAVGIGVEHRLTPNIGVKFETLYVDLADRTLHAVDPTTFPGETIDYRFSNDILMPRLAITYSF